MGSLLCGIRSVVGSKREAGGDLYSYMTVRLVCPISAIIEILHNTFTSNALQRNGSRLLSPLYRIHVGAYRHSERALGPCGSACYPFDG